MTMKNLQYVPKTIKAFDQSLFNKVHNQIKNSQKITILTGAGVSTASGIPDYRSPNVGLYARKKDHKPVLGYELAKNASRRQQYWARNFIAYESVNSRIPNNVHYFLKNWEFGQHPFLKADQYNHLITQNVDGLHIQAGSSIENTTELHGCMKRLKCLDCGTEYSRSDLQNKFEKENPNYLEKYAQKVLLAPDDDAIVSGDVVEKFNMATCDNCGSDRLKPDVVFFGDNVNRDIVDFCYEKVENSDLLLILGSTLEVFSSYRFAIHANKHDVDIISVGIGKTRADKYLKYKLECNLEEFCERIS